MKINIETYELYVIDYLEGTLSEELKAAFDVFLLMHPEIKDELDEIANIELKPNLELNLDKSLLEKDLFSVENIELHFEDLCIDCIENQFSIAEKIKFEAFLNQNPSKKHIFSQFEKTVLAKNWNQSTANFKSLLKQLILDDNSFNEELSIAYLEGDLTKNESQLFEEQLLLDANLLQKNNLYKHLKLKANKSIVFENKAGLYKKENVYFAYFGKFALAASILLFGFLLLPKMMTFDSRMVSNIGKFNESLSSNDSINSSKNEIVAISEQTATTLEQIKTTKKVIYNKHEAYEEKNEQKLLISEKPTTYLTTNVKLSNIEIPVSIESEQFYLKPNSQILANSQTIEQTEASKNQIPRIKFWKAASFVVTIFSKATDSDVLLTSEYDEKGNLMALDIVSEKFSYSKSYKR